MKLQSSIVGIHQPNFLPWLGYWCKLAASDEFILYDDCPLSRQSFTVRVLGGGHGEKWMHLATSKRPLGTAICEVPVCRRSCGRLQDRLLERYAHYPYVQELLDVVDGSTVGETVAGFNIGLIVAFSRALCPHTALLRASDLLAYQPGPAHLASLVSAVGGRTYLSGSGGRSYLPSDSTIFRSIAVGIFDAQAAAKTIAPNPEEAYLSIAAQVAMRGLAVLRRELAIIRRDRETFCEPLTARHARATR